MRFGKKAGTITSTTTGGGTDWPKALRAGETRVRFVYEIADWQEYWEHYDETVKFFPCTSDKNTCPGCTSTIERTAKASKRYLAPVLDPATGRVWGLKMGQELANRMSLRNDRNDGTVTNRDYTLIRSGTGLDTEYDVEQEEKVPIDLDAYVDVLDLDEMLAGQFAGAWPDFDPDNPPANGRAKTDAPRKRAARKKVTDEDEPAGPGTVEQLKAAASGVAPATATDDPPPWETSGTDEFAAKADEAQQPQAEAASADEGETVEITEEDLRKMGRSELIKLARQADLQVTLTMNRDAIIKKFLDEFSV